MYGRNFAPAIEKKFQLYVLVSFSVFLASSTSNSLGMYYSEDRSKFGTDFVVASFARVILLSACLICQILLAMSINSYSHLYNRALISASGTCAASAAALAKVQFFKKSESSLYPSAHIQGTDS
eukprot:Tamp_38591.p2 GENE.Tamp_38591~~Tamp_38591.p2  ORF type:complete len:124 (-),score=8.59 Tamp_38591:53-424(-)